MNGRASSSSSSFNYQWTYDVFINFRGEDTRHGFTGNLYKALCQKGIQTFIDDEELNKGDEVTSTLLEKIEQSRMAVTIFSKNYASSTFCLDELVKILQFIKGKGRLFWPIFYNVEPSDVRYQKGKFGEALDMHKKSFKADDEKVQNWKQALYEAANISGSHFNLGHEYEYIFIDNIVKEISSKIDRTSLHIANHPVGLEPRMQEIISLLENGPRNKVDMIGISGIGGIGKTTIARFVYYSIADQFQGLCFLHDMKENSSKLGLQQIQERMLSKILGVDIKVEDVNQGVRVMKRRLNQKKILLILDNVDKLEQLEKLAGGYDWFGSGSMIIITTRDKHLLARHGVERIYEMEELNDEESLELLCWNAFKKNIVDPSYMEILNDVVQYAQGLPLALEVIGSHLFGKSEKEWYCALDGYRKIPSKDIQQILKVSYDGLEEVEQKIFLDIASFFKGEHVKYVMNMVKYTHGFDPDYGIGVLIDKSLIKIENDCIKIHDLIQDMGREIVRQESPEEAGNRTRLWSTEDIVHVLENNTGTDKIRVIIQKYVFEDNQDIIVNWDGKAFEKMKNLKILILKKAWFSEGPKYLPRNLSVLQWWEYPASCLPIDFHPKKLVMFDLRGSCLQSLEPLKKMENVSVLNLSRSRFITQIPDISSIPNLTKLRLDGCENLIEIHDSVGYLGKLKILDVQWCVNLKTFPCRIKLPSLEYLGLQHCSSLKKFPEILEKMEYITSLDLSDTNLELPASICNLVRLHALIVQKCSGLQLPSSIAMLPTLTDVHIDRCSGELQSSKQMEGQEELSSMISSSFMRKLFLQNSNISDDFLPKCLTWFVNVKYLYLSGNNFSILPACIKECRLLEWLYLEECINLREIRGIPPNIKELLATNCTSLSSESRSILKSQELHEAGNKQYCVPGSTIPEWLEYRIKGASTSFWFHEKFPAISLCCVIGRDDHPFTGLCAEVIINGEKIEIFNEIDKWDITNCSLLEDHILFLDVSEWIIFQHYGIKEVSLATEWNQQVLSDQWNHVQVSINQVVNGEIYRSNLVKEMGIIVRKQEKRMEDIQFTNPCKRTKSLHDFYLGSSFIASTWTSGTTRDEALQPLNIYDCQVPELNGDNYRLWKEKILLQLGWMDADYAIRKDEPPTPTDTSSKSETNLYERWERSNHLSMMYIQSKISNSICGSLREHKNVRDLLKAIDEHFESSEKALTSTLMSKLSTMKLTGISGVREHFMKMRDIAAQLKTLEVELPDSSLMYFILNSLPPQYIISYNTYKQKLSINEILTMCVQEEGRLLAKMGESTHLTTHGKDKKQVQRKWKRKAPIQDDIKKESNNCFVSKKIGSMNKELNLLKALLDKIDAKKGIHAPDPSLKFMSKRDEQFTQKSELKLEIAKVAYKGKLVDVDGAERFLQLMQRLSHDRASDLSGRKMLVNVIAKTNWDCFTYYSVLMKGLPLLDKWIQDVLEGEFGDKESDKSIEEFLSASLLTLNKLPVSPYYLHSCKILNSLERLCNHQSYKIWNTAKCLLKKWNQILLRHIEGLENPPRSNKHLYGTENYSHDNWSVEDLEPQEQGYFTDSIVNAANISRTTSSVNDLALQIQGYSTGSDSSDSTTDTEVDLFDTSVNHVELQLKRKGKMKEDDNLPSVSNTYSSSSTMDFGELVIDSSNSHVQQAEAETSHTQFPESRVNIGLVHVCSQKDLAQTNPPILTSCDFVSLQPTCQNDKLTLNDNSLTWDPMEWEHQVACLKNQTVLNDQSTISERDDSNGMGSESSDQKRDPWHFCLFALFSSFLSLCSSSSSTIAS